MVSFVVNKIFFPIIVEDLIGLGRRNVYDSCIIRSTNAQLALIARRDPEDLQLAARLSRRIKEEKFNLRPQGRSLLFNPLANGVSQSAAPWSSLLSTRKEVTRDR